MRRFATAGWLRWFRRLTRELFSFVLVFVLQRYSCRRYRTVRGLAFPLQKLRTLIFDEQGYGRSTESFYCANREWFSPLQPGSHCIVDYKESCFPSARGNIDDWRGR